MMESGDIRMLKEMGNNLLANSPVYKMYHPDREGRSPVGPLDVQLEVEHVYADSFRTIKLEMFIYDVECILEQGSVTCRNNQKLGFSADDLLRPEDFLAGAFRLYGRLAPMTPGEQEENACRKRRGPALLHATKTKPTINPLGKLAKLGLVPGVDMPCCDGTTVFFPLSKFYDLGPEDRGIKFAVIGKPIIWRRVRKCNESFRKKTYERKPIAAPAFPELPAKKRRVSRAAIDEFFSSSSSSSDEFSDC